MSTSNVSRPYGVIAQQLQEERLAQLCRDNAFVDAGEVLRRQRRDASSANDDAEVDFLEPSSASSSAPPRLHLGRFLLDQHRTYLRTLEDHEEAEERAAASSNDDSSSSSNSPVEEVEPPRGGKKRRRAEKEKWRQMGGANSGEMTSQTASDSVLDDVRRECVTVRAWCQSRGVFPPEDTSAPDLSFLAMAAPPPNHPGGYHLCSVCLLPATYRCVRCRQALFCSIPCHVVHEATRCMKFIV